MTDNSKLLSTKDIVILIVAFALSIPGGVIASIIVGEGRFSSFNPTLVQWGLLALSLLALITFLVLLVARWWAVLRLIKILPKVFIAIYRWLLSNWQLVLALALLAGAAYGVFVLTQVLWAVGITLVLVLSAVLLARYRYQSQTVEAIKKRIASDTVNFLDVLHETFQHGLANWTYYGDWRIERQDELNILVITNSDKGGIINPCQTWTDYVFEFETKIVSKYTSWIIRAADIDNYVLLQCGQKALKLVHRGKGVWQNLQWSNENPIQLPMLLPLDTWFGVRIEMRNDHVVVVIILNGKRHTILDQPLSIPPFVGPGSYPRGAVGFRAHGDEVACFRHVGVKRIS